MSVIPMCYETQYFGFTPQTCILRLYISFQDYLFDMLLVVESVILKKLEKFPNSGINSFEIRESTEKYLSLLTERFNYLFQKLENCLLKLVLNIPRNILLCEDEIHANYAYSKEQFDVLQNEVQTLHRQYKGEKCVTQALLAELEEQKAVQAELEKILSWFDGLDKICREHGIIDLMESFAFMTQTSKKLQVSVKEIDLKHNKLALDMTSRTPVQLRAQRSSQGKLKLY
ncbi:PREDICTED: protein MIS12 homolog [Nanorana parkeri]|uniref:protein MIS12 homolog n=1 Tax=Nanorana parkeri TaxID=125878 RepID=UPI0008543E29|nr:PREDICTED: protein MIS12 homolog [Nanorana parkeri]